MGSLNPGDTVRRQVVVRGKLPFSITKVSSRDSRFSIDISAASTPKTVHILPVTFAAEGTAEDVVGTLYLEMNGSVSAGKIEAHAVIQDRDPMIGVSSAGEAGHLVADHP